MQGTGGGAGVTFPVTRGLYNLYNNSSATVPSNQATLNFMSEDGFLCKSSTKTDIDPQTGVAYRTEIEAAITANGFFPLDVTRLAVRPGLGDVPGSPSRTPPTRRDRPARVHATASAWSPTADQQQVAVQ